MANIVNRLIFNTLAAGRSVSLPEVGTLVVEQHSAEISGHNIKAPQRRVSFVDDTQMQNTESIVDIIAREGEISLDEAQGVYAQWRTDARHGNGINFEAVGIVENGIFTPTDEMERKLAPFGADNETKNKKIKTTMSTNNGNKRHNCFWWGILGVVIALFIVVEVLHFTGKFHSTSGCIGSQFSKTEQVDNGCAEPVVEADTIAKAPVVEQPVETAVNVGKTANTGKYDVISTLPEQTTYYLIAGVFSVKYNADKLIRKNPFYSNKYEKILLADGRTMVSVFSSTSRSNVAQRKFELEDIQRDLWIYRIEIK